MLAGCVLLLSACGEERLQALQKKINDQSSQQQLALQQLSERVDALESTPQYRFILSSLNHSINEQMFQPLLTTTADLKISGGDAPASLYVDMVLEIKSEKDKIDLALRQIYPLLEGHGHIEMHQPLPVHGLKTENLSITLKPVNWYQGEAISDKEIEYR